MKVAKRLIFSVLTIAALSFFTVDVKAISEAEVKESVEKWGKTIRRVVVSDNCNWGSSQHKVKKIFEEFLRKLEPSNLEKLGAIPEGVREQITNFESNHCPQPKLAYALLSNLEILVQELGFCKLRVSLDSLDDEIARRWPEAQHWTQGIAGRRAGNPTSVTIHNANGKNGAAFYKEFIEGRPAAQGFAHEYWDQEDKFEAEPIANRAWHCGDIDGNRESIGLEVLQDLEEDPLKFLGSELLVIRRTAALLKQFGLPANDNTIKFHCELVYTECPWRTVQVHGLGDHKDPHVRARAKAWFVAEVQKEMNGEALTPIEETLAAFLEKFEKWPEDNNSPLIPKLKPKE